MTLTELRYIVAVARERHFGRAAEASFVSQPTLSVAIKKLEDELGVILFERSSGDVVPTLIGARIVEQAQRVLEQAGAIREIAKSGKDPLKGPLKLGVIYTIAPYLLPQLVRHLHRSAPQMPLLLQENYTDRLRELLKQGDIDCAVLALPFEEPGFAIEPVYDETFVVAVPRDHAWAKRKSVVLATGADPIRLPLTGEGAAAVLSVNDLGDYARFRAAIEGGKRVAILGAGLIGCEFANDLVLGGHTVDVADIAPQALGRLLPPEAAAVLHNALAAAGVRWHLGKKTVAVDRAGTALVLRFDDGTHIEADVVLSAVGLAPRTALARAAGLAVKRGIVVDRFLRTSDADVYALGDCAEVEGQVLPFVPPIMHAARALASTISGSEKAVIYPPMPVLVKTPALPTVVCPPAPGAAGAWQIEPEAGGTLARYVDAAGRLIGYALTGAATAHKNRLLKEMQTA